MPALKRSREDVSADEGVLLPTLYGYWRSSASWRVRIACEYKKLPYLYHAVNLLKGEECSEEYLKINPMGQLPTWVQPVAASADKKKGAATSSSTTAASEDIKETEEESNDDTIIINQSMAILEFLDETHPNTPQLLPPTSDPIARAAVRDLSLLIVSGIHPIQNNYILGKVEKLAGGGMPTKSAWAKDTITEGFAALEVALAHKKKTVPGKFCYGDNFTMVDACLIPQLYNGSRFGVDMSGFPTLNAIIKNYESLDFLAAAHPDAMPDATS